MAAIVRDARAMLASLSASERYDVEERAAIMEFDGGLSRDEAERAALSPYAKSEVIVNAMAAFDWDER